MRVRLREERSLAWFAFLNSALQKHITEDIKKQGKWMFDVIWEIPDDSAIARLLNIIDDVVDRGGLPVINWINSRSYDKLAKEITKLELSSLPKMKSLPSNFEDILIKSNNGGNFSEITENPTVNILFKHRSYTESKNFAINYLKKKGPNKRVHITGCRIYDITPYMLYLVWAKK